jgi:hypothetical protein
VEERIRQVTSRPWGRRPAVPPNPRATPPDLERAEGLARSAIDSAPAKVNYLDTLAVILAARGNFSEAMDMEERAIKLLPSGDARIAEFGSKIDAWKARRN